jgi:hypothetical protein
VIGHGGEARTRAAVLRGRWLDADKDKGRADLEFCAHELVGDRWSTSWGSARPVLKAGLYLT